MINNRRKIHFRWLYKRSFWLLFFLTSSLGFIRWTKGSFFLDSYAIIMRPFWPGPAQKEWIITSTQVEKNIKLRLLEADNLRLRKMLNLQRNSSDDLISAAVIARTTDDWWQHLELNKGKSNGVKKGNAVIGPGGLIGIIKSTSFLTSRVRLLTSPGSRIGVWIERNKSHAILIGMGTNRTKLKLLDNQVDLKPGDVVATSPASTILPPNLVVGVIQSVNTESLPGPYAIVQLSASPESIDWVQILR